jgi:hypothetical protein
MMGEQRELRDSVSLKEAAINDDDGIIEMGQRVAKGTTH